MKAFTYKTTVFFLIAFVIVACETVPKYEEVSKTQSVTTKDSVNALSTTSMKQIGRHDRNLNAGQIMRSAGNNLTIDQLKVYADRCGPTATMPVPEGLDCSELRLRMKRVFRSDDKVAEALFTLNRLSQRSKLQNDLGNDQRYSDVNAGAIAGLTLQDGSTLSEEPVTDFTNFLESNGLSLDAGVIIVDSGG